MDQSPKINLLTLALARSGGGSGVSDVKVDNTSVVDEEGNVNLVTKTAYNASTNKLATEGDIPTPKVYMHMIAISQDWYQFKVQIYNSTSEPYTDATFKAFLTAIGATGGNAANSWIKGFPVIWTQSSIGSEWGVGSNKTFTDFKVNNNNNPLSIVSIRTTFTIDGTDIKQATEPVLCSNEMVFRSDTVTEL